MPAQDTTSSFGLSDVPMIFAISNSGLATTSFCKAPEAGDVVEAVAGCENAFGVFVVWESEIAAVSVIASKDETIVIFMMYPCKTCFIGLDNDSIPSEHQCNSKTAFLPRNHRPVPGGG